MYEALRCDTRRFELSMVLQMVHTQGLTGRLSIEADAAPLGIADFYGGKVIAASCGPASGTTGFLELFLVPTTRATFATHTPTPTAPLGSLLAMILEGCRLRDEWAQMGPRTWVPDPERALEAPSSPPGLRSVLATLDGLLTLEEAVLRAGVARATVLDALRAMIDAGMLRPASPSGAEPLRSTEPSPESRDEALSFLEALAAGRRHYSRGNLDSAAEAFLEATRLRPSDRIARQNLHRLWELHPELSTPKETP